MAVPDEDRGPLWLQDYGHTDFGGIAADIVAMEQFARKLAAEVQNNYAAHLPRVTEAMLTTIPPSPTFCELTAFLGTHLEAQKATHNNVYNFANGTNIVAVAAQRISERYRGSDAFARARVADVDAAFPHVAAPSGTGKPAAGA